MLLEYHLNSGPAEPISDGKTSTIISQSQSNDLHKRSAEEFKNALRTSIDSRNKYHNKQTDKSHSESDLLKDIKSWDNLHAKSDTANQESISTVTPTDIPIIAEAKLNKENSDLPENPPTLEVGEVVPNDGSILPANTAIKSDNESVKLATSDFLGAKVVGKSGDVVGEDKNATAKKASSDVITSSIINTDIKVSVNKESEINPAEEKKNTDQQNTTLDSTNLNSTELKTSMDINSALQSNRLTEVENKQSEKSVADNTKAGPASKLNPYLATKEHATFADNKQSIASVATTTDETNKGIDLKSVKGANTHLQQQKAELDALKVSNMASVITNKQSDKLSDKLSEPKDGKKIVENINIISKLSNGGEHFATQTKRDDSILRAVTQNIETISPTDTQSKSNALVITESQSVQQSLNQATTNLQTTKASDVPLQASVPTSQWNQKFAEHVSMLALRGTNNAQIRLAPPELGPMAIKIHHHGSETQIQFIVNNPIARELVDSGMQRLRDMLEQHGFENVDVDVSEFTQQDKSTDESENMGQDIDDKYADSSSPLETTTSHPKNNALIDLFA